MQTHLQAPTLEVLTELESFQKRFYMAGITNECFDTLQARVQETLAGIVGPTKLLSIELLMMIGVKTEPGSANQRKAVAQLKAYQDFLKQNRLGISANDVHPVILDTVSEVLEKYGSG